MLADMLADMLAFLTLIMLSHLNYCVLIWGQGSHPTWKTLKSMNFVIYFSIMYGNCLKFAQKVGETWNFKSNPAKKQLYFSKFSISRFTFQDVIYKCFYTSL